MSNAYQKYGKNKKKIVEKSVLVFNSISAQFGQFTASDCEKLYSYVDFWMVKRMSLSVSNA